MKKRPAGDNPQPLRQQLLSKGAFGIMTNIYESDLFNNLPDRSLHPGGLRLTDRAVRLAGLSAGQRCADLGCGTGATCAYLTEKYKLDMTGFDLSEKLVSIGLQRYPGLQLLCHDCQALPLDTGDLDAVFMECTLSVIGEAPAVLAECARVLKPSGKIILSDITLISQAASINGGPYTVEQLTALLNAAGFSIQTCEDHTPALKTYAAELTMNGGAEALRQCGLCNEHELRLSALGYHLFIAERK
jgi:SAM-dependent methyltransferase